MSPEARKLVLALRYAYLATRLSAHLATFNVLWRLGLRKGRILDWIEMSGNRLCIREMTLPEIREVVEPEAFAEIEKVVMEMTEIEKAREARRA